MFTGVTKLNDGVRVFTHPLPPVTEGVISPTPDAYVVNVAEDDAEEEAPLLSLTRAVQ
jgi:hypothetical protein